MIRGNAAVLKCSIPSFVADFVRVESWIDELGTVLQADGLDYGECRFVELLLDELCAGAISFYIPTSNDPFKMYYDYDFPFKIV